MAWWYDWNIVESNIWPKHNNNNTTTVEYSGSVSRALDWGSKGKWLVWDSAKILCCILEHDTIRCKGSHRLEKYLNIEVFLEKYLKIKSALKSAGKLQKGLEKVLEFYVGLNTDDRELNQYKIAVLYLVQHAAPNKGTTILYYFSSTNFSIISV